MKTRFVSASIIASLISLSLSPFSSAEPLANQTTIQSSQSGPSEISGDSPYIVGKFKKKFKFKRHHKHKKFFFKALVQGEEMIALAEQGLQSDDPEIRKMSEELLASADTMMSEILEMFIEPVNP